MIKDQQDNNSSQTQPVKIAVSFSVTGDIKFLSHRDTVRLFERACSRARIPLKFSQGFNPHARLSLPLPRNVGLASQAEIIILGLDRPYPPKTIKTDLGRHLPAGIEITALAEIDPQLSPRPRWARYVFTLDDSVDLDALDENIEHLLESPTWPIYRPARGRHPEKNFDLRKCVRDLKRNDNMIQCTFEISDRGAARPEEMLDCLQLKYPGSVPEINRTAVGYMPEINPGD